MGSSGGSATLRAEEVVRRFYDFLARGRLVDALNLFTTDARLRDASGRESAGIRAITSSLLTYRVPQDIAVEQMEPEDGEIRATVRSPSGRSVGRFSVARGRIKSLRMERAQDSSAASRNEASGLEHLFKTLVDARELRDVPAPCGQDPGVPVLEVLQGVAHGVFHVLGVHVLRDRGRNRVQASDEVDRVGSVSKLVEITRLRREGLFHELLDGHEHPAEDVPIEIGPERVRVVADQDSGLGDDEEFRDSPGGAERHAQGPRAFSGGAVSLRL